MFAKSLGVCTLPCVRAASRTYLGIVGGVVAGVLGLTNLRGILFYFVTQLMLSLACLAKMNFKWAVYFPAKKHFISMNILAAASSYVAACVFFLSLCVFFRMWRGNTVHAGCMYSVYK